MLSSATTSKMSSRYHDSLKEQYRVHAGLWNSWKHLDLKNALKALKMLEFFLIHCFTFYSALCDAANVASGICNVPMAKNWEYRELLHGTNTVQFWKLWIGKSRRNRNVALRTRPKCLQKRKLEAIVKELTALVDSYAEKVETFSDLMCITVLGWLPWPSSRRWWILVWKFIKSNKALCNCCLVFSTWLQVSTMCHTETDYLCN